MAEADHLDRMGASPQHVLRRDRLEPCDHAHGLAGADIERCDQGRALRRDRLHLGGDAELERVHASPPLRFCVLALIASARAAAAASDRRTATRSALRRSIAAMSRDSSLLIAIERDHGFDRLGRACFRQADIDAVLEPQIPAPLGDQHIGVNLLLQLRIEVHHRKKIGSLDIGALADDQRQMRDMRGDEGLDHDAVARDHPHPAVSSARARRHAVR